MFYTILRERFCLRYTDFDGKVNHIYVLLNVRNHRPIRCELSNGFEIVMVHSRFL